jgi:NHS family xanthosine MFS transporter
MQLYVSAVAAFILGCYAFFLSPFEVNEQPESKSIIDILGLRAFTLFKDKQMAVFFLFSMLLGAALQITNGFGDFFLGSFASIPEYTHSFGVEHSVILLSVSQISETLFILTIPFFMKRFGIKKVMLMSMFAWVLRFGLFGLGNPGNGLPLLILSMIVYGMAFDFFNISGSLFVEQTTDSKIRASAQGLFMLMTNGIGAIIGSYAAGAIVNHYVTHAETPNWSAAWYIFAGYALVVGILFAVFFRYKQPQKDF